MLFIFCNNILNEGFALSTFQIEINLNNCTRPSHCLKSPHAVSFAVHFFASLLETVAQSFSLMLMENTYLLGPFYYLDVGE